MTLIYATVSNWNWETHDVEDVDFNNIKGLSLTIMRGLMDLIFQVART